MLETIHLRLTENLTDGPTEVDLHITVRQSGRDYLADIDIFPEELQSRENAVFLLESSIAVLQGEAEGFEVELVSPEDADFDEVLDLLATALACVDAD